MYSTLHGGGKAWMNWTGLCTALLSDYSYREAEGGEYGGYSGSFKVARSLFKIANRESRESSKFNCNLINN